MIAAAKPIKEEERLLALASYKIMDTLQERSYDDIVKLASSICETPIALVSLIDKNRQWFKAKFGLEAKETSRDIAFCSHAILQEEAMVVPDATKDLRFADNPLVTGDLGIRFYAGAPLTTFDGHKLGTLCVIDRVPRDLSSSQIRSLSSLAHQIEIMLDLRKKTSAVNEYLTRLDIQHTQLVELEKDRQELVSLVVHDLKSPITVNLMNAETILELAEPKSQLYESAKSIMTSSEAMMRLVMNVLDVSNSESRQLKPVLSKFNFHELLSEIVGQAEIRLRKSGQRIALNIASHHLKVESDATLLRRVLENLIDNALKYAPGKGNLITIDVSEKENKLIFKVRDQGPGIKIEDREAVFQKYVRLQDHLENKNGSRGLGLTFCRLAAVALGGNIWIESNSPRGSAFCFKILR